MYRVPEVNMRSTPNTERTIEGKPKAQYVTFGFITAKRRQAIAVPSVPIANEILITRSRKMQGEKVHLKA